MFTEETVFILGAGASWHYGYPTGEDLVQRVRKRAYMLENWWNETGHHQELLLPSSKTPKYFLHLNVNLSDARSLFIRKCKELNKRLEQVHPLVIDYFLQQNEDLQDIGKLIISHVILECEQRYKKKGGNVNHKSILENSPDIEIQKRAKNLDVTKYRDNWCRFIIDKTISNCNSSHHLNDNKINFITFNYDVSLEYQLYQAIQSTQLFSQADKYNFFNNPYLFIHPYGLIRSSVFDDSSFGIFPDFFTSSPMRYNDIVDALDKSWASAEQIKTIAGNKTSIDDPIIKIAKEKIKNARHIYILGFGFDENNNDLLDLKKSLRRNSDSTERNKIVYFTNYGNRNRINKKASKLFFKSEDEFLERYIARKTISQTWHFEKSIKNVYDALAEDFDL